MGINRYLYYLIFLNMIINVVVLVPNILINDRFNGALMAMLVSIPISLTLIYFFGKAIARFPGMGLPEILKDHLPKWGHHSTLFLFGVMWYLIGLIPLLVFVSIIKDYINQDNDRLLIISVLLILLVFCCRLNSKTLLYGMEVLLVINVPLVLFLIAKLLINKEMNWDAILEIGTHFFGIPSLQSIAAATFMFTGYTNMVIFQRIFEGKFKFKHIWMIGVLGLLFLLTSFFIPIGYQGTDGVANYMLPWLVTADSIRIEFFVVERVLYLFIFVYISIGLIGTIIFWHIALDLLKNIFPEKSRDKSSWAILILFSAVAMTLEIFLNEYDRYDFTSAWLIVRLFGELLLVLIMSYAARKKALK
ncbi:GerAB/ArcD/ProY family transporter [Aquibacillus sp. 3ASR75-11]|uniref:GerAB/ArcD/ProY family transporter n=1 Tax=Terrihalobacillus insolitus TaxID=2950438 RepID=A0A9X4ALX5_9BACI|nr:GerAB/ArcD/ProY family transporter [Terrihalobacillus insolitus]MDC3412402.1 GerAB/ArcD/ProY family transporter [Terrihalobacillus insolitus]MDC3422905.1 GerAB/ArcD/ProY family transporter [Terrihalobacillus insolitus]